jgi:hypothetical protein
VNTVTISGHFSALAGGHLNLQTQTGVISVHISGDGAINSTGEADNVVKVSGHDSSGTHRFTWAVPKFPRWSRIVLQQEARQFDVGSSTSTSSIGCHAADMPAAWCGYEESDRWSIPI